MDSTREEKREEEDKNERAAVEARRPPQIIHKSSKELYKAVAAQWGITCKMSDHCRCLDCQVNNWSIRLLNFIIP